MNSKSNTQAMETEKIPRLLARLAIPAVVAQIINLLYNIVDRIYIGHIPGVGAAALTGVGLFTPILMLINACAMLAGSGGAPRAAISMGKKDNKTAEKILGNCFVILLLMAVALTVLFFAFAPQLLTLFGASDQTLPYGVDYARIYNESIYYDTGICEDQHDDNCDWCCDQYYSGSDLYLCISSWSKGCCACNCFESGCGGNMDPSFPVRKENDPAS